VAVPFCRAAWRLPDTYHTAGIRRGPPPQLLRSPGQPHYLSLTVSFDHNMIDGAPAARFTQRLKELVESGYGLTGQEVSAALNGSQPQPQVV
jgi:hypothetical protein